MPDTAQHSAATNGVGPALPAHVDIAIVGSGFSGLGMAIKLKDAGREDFVVLERAEDVGGTWQANTYPGCQCDVPSNLYSFSFAPNPDWSQTFALQPEIWAYLRRVADEYGIRPHVRLRCEVLGAEWDEGAGRWRIETSRGALTARVLVAGTGGLSEPALPDIPGMETFAGPAFHTARWEHDAELAGKRVAVIGTGASAVQVIPRIQPLVGQLSVFQRTPPWIMPHPGRSVRPRERLLFRMLPWLQRAVRGAVYWGRETYVLPFKFHRLSRLPERIARAHLEKQVADPRLRAELTPDYEIGCKRILMSNEYFPALQQPNVELVTSGIRELRPHAILTTDGTEHPVDAIVYGTGFRVSDMPVGERLRGAGGCLLGDVWREQGLSALRGTTMAGFPNLFMLVGPNTGLGHNSIVFMIESQLAYVMDALRAMDAHGATVLDTRPGAQAAFNDELQAAMRGTVWTEGGCASWYLDARGRNTTLWPGTSWSFRRATRRFDLAEHVLRAETAEPRETAAVVC
ncbi:MAG: NAD(P)/FAD-dependent oxidoreductase [Conexibacter sp.]